MFESAGGPPALLALANAFIDAVSRTPCTAWSGSRRGQHGRARSKQRSSPCAGGHGVGFDSLRPVRRQRTVKPSGVPGQ
jgi:hypothetical protein